MEAFRIDLPRAARTPVIVEVPHAGIFVPAPVLATLTAPARAIGRDADLYVDELYADAPDIGATVLAANVSRYAIDLNRSEEDVDEGVVVGGKAGTAHIHGLVWRQTTNGEVALARPLLPRELRWRLDAIHRPYHQALSNILAETVRTFGVAVVLAAHSMPSAARAAHRDLGKARADVVPGTRSRTSASPAFIDAVDEVAGRHGLSVRHDDPYKGGFTTGHYGRPETGVHVVQIELSRRLYMDEESLVRLDGHHGHEGPFGRTRSFCCDLVETFGRLATERGRRKTT
jgi:N-formylglutamate deformylase